MADRIVEGLDGWRETVRARRRLAEDLAAASVMPGVSNVDDFLDRLKVLVRTDPARAGALYWRWAGRLR